MKGNLPVKTAFFVFCKFINYKHLKLGIQENYFILILIHDLKIYFCDKNFITKISDKNIHFDDLFICTCHPIKCSLACLKMFVTLKVFPSALTDNMLKENNTVLFVISCQTLNNFFTLINSE